MAALLSDLVISAVPTFALSRVLLCITRRRISGVPRLITVHALVLALCVGIGLVTFEGAAPSRLGAALALFTPTQTGWLLVDAFRMVNHQRRAGR
jgi:hypothetical protein